MRAVERPVAATAAHGVEELDDLEAFIAESSPSFHAAIDDAECRHALLRSLVSERSRLGLTQRSIAESMETSQSAISELEGGLTDPRLSTLQRYARALGAQLAVYLHAGPLRSFEWLPPMSYPALQQGVPRPAIDTFKEYFATSRVTEPTEERTAV